MSLRMNRRRRRNLLQTPHPRVYRAFRDDEDPFGFVPKTYRSQGEETGLQSPYTRQIQAFKRGLRLIKAFRAADSDRDERINAQELDRIREILDPAAAEKTTLDSISLGPEDTIGISDFVGLKSDKLGPDDEFLKALGMAQRDGSGKSFLTGEDLCEALLAKGIRLSIRDTEEMVTAVDSFGVRAMRPNELELLINALC